jgi:hypothetical protein
VNRVVADSNILISAFLRRGKPLELLVYEKDIWREPALIASVAIYDALPATTPGIDREGAAMPYTSVNGNMFSLFDR